jgi:hypothetical protein
MTERSQRRATERKALKRANKSTAPAVRAMASGQSDPLQAVGLDLAESPLVEMPGDRNVPINRNSTQISDAQLAANRANSLHSTGPTSSLGKSISARNNLRHGLTQSDGELVLLETESKEEYLDSLAAFQQEWRPETATENDLVNRLACHQWLRRRALKLQTHYLSPTDGQILDASNFALYHRYEVVHERAYNKALSDLIRLHGLRLREKNGFESQQRKDELQQYRIRALKHRESLHQFALRTAESRFALMQNKLEQSKPADADPPDEREPTN